MKNLLILVLLGGFLSKDSFKAEQLAFDRVKTAYHQKLESVERQLLAKRLSLQNMQLYLRAFKQEQVLEVWVKNKADLQFQLLTAYPFCETSGTLGPKRREGDKQIPEGYYVIDRFNPQSNFYLSLGLDYPNAADRLKGQGRLGGDIFIHGDCVTIGCLAITDDKIKELYLLAVEAYATGQTSIPVHIFPARFNHSTYRQLQQRYAQQPQLLAFWENLKGGYAYFEANKRLPEVQVDKSGNYFYK